MQERFHFSKKTFLWRATLVAFWFGAWAYMAEALFSYAPDRHIWFFPFLGCFVLACATCVELIRLALRLKGSNYGLVLAIIFGVVLNVAVFCVVCSHA